MLCWILLVCAFYASLAFGVGDVTWAVGQKFQIILSAVPDAKAGTTIVPSDAEVWDFDLFDGDAATIAALQAQNKLVICYFSAGTYEPNRPDVGNFTAADKGTSLAPQWPDEYWLNTKSANVRRVMQNRILLAAAKGCNAVDPDNMDAYDNNGGGMGLTQADAINYLTFLSTTAKSVNLSIGLKNAIQIIPQVESLIQFAVNEECAYYGECAGYAPLLSAGKPVYHIEYPNAGNTLPASAADQKTFCDVTGITGLSTVMKHLSLDGQVEYCDGSLVTTPTKNPSGTNPWAPGQSHPSSRTTRTTMPRTSTSTRSTTSTRPTTTSSVRTTTASSSRPTSTGGGGGNGCTAKHWDQCGGQNWSGCTVCASGLTCKGVSPPYYYQCL